MKITKFLISFVLVMLSFFNAQTFAKEYEMDLDHTGLSGVKLKTDSKAWWEIFKDAQDSLYINCKETGVYTIQCIDENTGVDSSSWDVINYSNDLKWVRLACYETQRSDDGRIYYQMYSPRYPSNNGRSTSVKVVLFEGSTYVIESDSENAVVNITCDDEDNSHPYKQSEYVSTTRTHADEKERHAEDWSFEKEYVPVNDKGKVVYNMVGGDASTKGNLSASEKVEKAIVQLLLAIGDFIVKKLNDIVGEDVTISNLIYNRVATVNPNFYDPNNAGIAHVDVQAAITKWYKYFSRLCFYFYLIAILFIGLRVLFNSTAKGIQEGKALAKEWLKGFLYFILMPYGIFMLFRINEILVREISGDANAETAGKEYTVGSSFTDGLEWSVEAIEYRSPDYVSKHTGIMGYGTDEANEYYIKKANDYAINFDLMRLARAYAGATFKITYTFIWYILIGQLITFIYIYYKRYFMISFFIAVFPVICIFQAIGIMRTGKAGAVGKWAGELISNIFTQFIHAVVYTIITAFIVSILSQSLTNPDEMGAINWVIIIVAINFVPEGEKIVRTILKSLSRGRSAEGLGEGGLRKGVGALRRGAHSIAGSFGK